MRQWGWEGKTTRCEGTVRRCDGVVTKGRRIERDVRSWKSLEGRNCDGRYAPTDSIEIRDDYRTVGCREEPLDAGLRRLRALTLLLCSQCH